MEALALSPLSAGEGCPPVSRALGCVVVMTGVWRSKSAWPCFMLTLCSLKQATVPFASISTLCKMGTAQGPESDFKDRLANSGKVLKPVPRMLLKKEWLPMTDFLKSRFASAPHVTPTAWVT